MKFKTRYEKTEGINPLTTYERYVTKNPEKIRAANREALRRRDLANRPW